MLLYGLLHLAGVKEAAFEGNQLDGHRNKPGIQQ